MVKWREVRSPDDLKAWLEEFRSMTDETKDFILKEMVEFLGTTPDESIGQLAADACFSSAVQQLTRGSEKAPRKRRRGSGRGSRKA